MRTALLNVPYATVKTEAAHLGIHWAELPLTDVLVQSFEDGSAVIMVRDGADANRLLDHLLDLGLARSDHATELAPASARA